jgi:hypothetical protein
MANTIWASNGGVGVAKLYLTSGEFSSTLKDSEAIGGYSGYPVDVSYDGNIPWVTSNDDKLFLQSGLITSTVKTSLSTSSIGDNAVGVSTTPDVNTPIVEQDNNKFYLLSGQFTTTIKLSMTVPAAVQTPRSTSYSGGNIAVIGIAAATVFLYSGVFTSTVKDSVDLHTVDSQVWGISYDGTDSPFSGTEADKLYLISGQYTSTIKTSQSIGGVSTYIRGITTDNVMPRYAEIPDTPTDFECTPGQEKNTLYWTESESADTYNLYWLNSIIELETFENLDSWVESVQVGTGSMSLESGRLRISIPDSGLNNVLGICSNSIPSSDFIFTVDVPGYAPFDTSKGIVPQFSITDSQDRIDEVRVFFRQVSGSEYEALGAYVDSGAQTNWTTKTVNERPTGYRIERVGTSIKTYFLLNSGYATIGSHDFGDRSENLLRYYLRGVSYSDRGGYVEFDNLKWHIKAQGAQITSLTGASYVHSGLTTGQIYYYSLTALNTYGESDESSMASGIPIATQILEPQNKFTIGSSDFTDRVLKWPTIKRTVNQLKSSNVSIPLANTDGYFNLFYNNLYTIPNTCLLQVAEMPAGDYDTVYTGFLKDVQFKRETCVVKLKDRLWDFTGKKIGESDAPASLGNQIPSDIAWTLCTCYGELDDTTSTSNTDINYESFAAWAAIFSRDSIECAAHYKGTKITDALERLVKMNNSNVFVDAEGKVNFHALIDIASNDQLITEDEYTNVEIDIKTTELINRQFVYGGYNVESNYWAIVCKGEDQTSIDSYGLNIDLMKDDTIWFVDSVSAVNLADKKVISYKNPPKTFTISLPMLYYNKRLGDRVRFTDSFFTITSADTWRISETRFDMNNGKTVIELDGAQSFGGFILDVSYLDGPDLLL